MESLPTLYVTQGSGNNIKPVLIARQLGLEVVLKFIDVLAGEQRQAEFMSINPQGVVPYMRLPDGTGLGESNAIAWYLAEGSALMPDTALARAQAVAWMNFEQTKLEANISPVRFFTFIVPDLAAEHADMIPVWRERGNAALAQLNDYLNGRKFITDYGYSVADVAVFGYTHLANEGGFNLSAYPAICEWIGRIEQQPGYQPINELLDGIDTGLRQAV